MNDTTSGASAAAIMVAVDGVDAEIDAIERMLELARTQRAAVAHDDIEALDAAGQEIDALLRECSRLRRMRESTGAPLAEDDSARLRNAAQRFVDALAINRRVLREAISGVNERAANLYRPTSALYGRPEVRAGGVAP